MNCVLGDTSTANAKLEAFESAIASSKFEIFTFVEDRNLVVIRNTSLEDGIDGRFYEITIDEIVAKPIEQLMSVLNGDRPSIVCLGITRIVGYYSRVNNWNKSKVGELRDRNQRNYGVTLNSPKFEAEREKAINRL